MATRSEYGQREVEAAKSVLIELMQILGEYRDDMVLIGGWVPFFLLGREHTGSMDVDIALDRKQITEDVYRTIRQHLEARGYRQGEQPFIFTREVQSGGDPPVVVEVDFLAGEYGGAGKNHRHQEIQGDLKARKARGCELAFDYNTRITVTGQMPNGSANSVQLNLSDVVPFLVMKGMALHDRMKEKDAWDIVFCVRRFEGGIEELARAFEPILGHGLVQEGLSKIRSKFSSVDGIGPAFVADFEEISEREERARFMRDAYERVNAFLDRLNIGEFKG